MEHDQTVAVLGAGGTMGFAMARNLARAGFRVRGWNRSIDKAKPLADDGIEVVEDPGDAVNGADVILTILADADAVLEAIQGVDDSLRSGAIWLQMSTIGEEGTDRCTEFAREHDLTLVDAPVLGTKQPAQEGKLVILASGPEELRDRVKPLLEPLGQRTIWAGEAGAGTRLKLATNSWLLTVVEGAAETLALAGGLGLDPRLVLQAVEGGPLDLPYLQMKGSAMLERKFEPSFKLELGAKDARLVQAAAESHGLELPLLRTIRDRLQEGVEEHGDEDVSATYLTSVAD